MDVISVEYSEKDKYTDLCERELLWGVCNFRSYLVFTKYSTGDLL